MLKALEPFTFLLSTVAIGGILIFFRADVRRLVGWVVGLRRLEKTKDGYAVESGAKPGSLPEVSEKKEQAIAAVEAVEVVSVSTASPAITKSVESWVEAVIDNRFGDALALLEKESETTTDPEQRLTSQSVIGYVKFQQNAASGVAYFEHLIEQHPTKLQPYQWYALTYLWIALPDKAIVILDRGLEAVEKKASLLDTKSDCLVRIGRLDDAIAAATKGVAADPTFVANHLNLARIYEKRGETADARRWYGRALSDSNGAVHVLDAFARFLGTHGTVSETIECYNKLTARQPKNSEYLTLLGNAYLAAELNGLALETYLRANELADGKKGWILANIGNLYNNKGLYAEATKYLKQAVQLEPDSQYAHERLAQAQKLDGDEREKLTALLEAGHSADTNRRLLEPAT